MILCHCIIVEKADLYIVFPSILVVEEGSIPRRSLTQSKV